MATAQDIEKILCHQCYAVLDVEDSFCRHCGAPLGDVTPPSEAVARALPDRSGQPAKLMENRWAVLIALFLVLGPLAMPMLWRSRQFSPLWKTILTTLVLGVTMVLLWIVWYYTFKALEPLRELRNL